MAVGLKIWPKKNSRNSQIKKFFCESCLRLSTIVHMFHEVVHWYKVPSCPSYKVCGVFFLRQKMYVSFNLFKNELLYNVKGVLKKL